MGRLVLRDCIYVYCIREDLSAHVPVPLFNYLRTYTRTEDIFLYSTRTFVKTVSEGHEVLCLTCRSLPVGIQQNTMTKRPIFEQLRVNVDPASEAPRSWQCSVGNASCSVPLRTRRRPTRPESHSPSSSHHHVHCMLGLSSGHPEHCQMMNVFLFHASTTRDSDACSGNGHQCTYDS